MTTKPFLYRLYVVFALIASIHSYSVAAPVLHASDVCSTDPDIEAAWGLYCPPDAYASCTDELWDLSSYGWAYVHDYSGYTYLYHPTVEHHLSSCNTGYITRTWTAYNAYSGTHHSCSQTIHVGGGAYGSFGYDDIQWPVHEIRVEGCHPNINPYQGDTLFAPPTWGYVACSQVGVSYTDAVFTVNSSCKKVIRTWKVVDWCQHNPYTGAGKWTYEQTIKIINADPPSYTCPDDVTVSSANCRDAFVSIPPLVVDASSCGGHYSVTNNSPYATSSGNDLSGTYPVGTTKVKYIINYGCGYKKNCHVEITVSKDKPPTPYCLHTITTALMPVDTDGDHVIDDGMVEIWAEDLDRSSTASCGAGPLQFSFSSDVTDKSRMFTCAQAGRNPVQVWVTDRYGNQDWCLAYVIVQNNAANIPDCEPLNYNSHPSTPLALQGQVLLPDGSPVQEATMRLVDMGVWLPKYVEETTTTIVIDTIVAPNGSITYEDRLVEVTELIQVRPTEHPTYDLPTDAGGLYERDSIMARHNDYMLHTAAVADDRPVIDLDDAHFLMSYILGLEPLTTPYQYIAADINQDQTINIRDFTLLYDHVKRGTPLPTTQPWVVVDGGHVWSSPSAALTYCPDEVMINTEDDHVMGQDWYAIRVGDLTDEQRTFTAERPQIGAMVETAAGAGAIDPSTAQQLRSLMGAPAMGVTVYPNPFSHQLTVACTVDSDQLINITIYTIDGRILYQADVQVAVGSQALPVEVPGDYTGVLIYEVTHAQGSQTGRLIKQ